MAAAPPALTAAAEAVSACVRERAAPLVAAAERHERDDVFVARGVQHGHVDIVGLEQTAPLG